MAAEKRVVFRSAWLPWVLIAPQVVIIAVFFFDGDRIVNERVYFDSASLVTQIGRGEILALVGEPGAREEQINR